MPEVVPMLIYPEPNPIAFHVLGWPIYWYGLTYLFGFLGGWSLLRYRCREGHTWYHKDQLADLLCYVALGVMIGGRLGYMVFYNLSAWIEHPWLILQNLERWHVFPWWFNRCVVSSVVICA